MSPQSPQQLSFHGTGGTLFVLYLQNLLLSIVTLGIYSFWGRTRVRQYLWSQTDFAGDRFAYHGTGKDLLVGWAKAMGALLVLYLLTLVGIPAALESSMGRDAAVGVGALVFYVIIALLVPIAVVGARRYRSSRTSWRGIRFSFHGRVLELLRLYVVGALLMLVTLTIYSPFFRNHQRRFFTEHTRFGSLPFAYDGEGQALVQSYLINLLLTIPTLGLCWFWYEAKQDRYYWAHTAIGDARFSSTMTGGQLLGVTLLCLVLSLVTLGIGAPWAMVRLQRYRCETLVLAGTVDLAAIQQQAQVATGTGEGLSTALDLDGFDAGL